MANIGKSITFKGDLSGDEDLVIEGRVEGKVELPNNELTIGANGHVTAEIHAKGVVVVGRLTGDIQASERVEVQSTGIVDGDIRSPRLVVQEGAVLNGSVEMGSSSAGKSRSERPVPAAAAGAEKAVL